MKVLLSDGSGLTARQVATQLSAAGHTVEALTPDPLALTRFTRHVRRVHRAPAYGADPFSWLDAALAVMSTGNFDVLLPTQEQVAVLAVCATRLETIGVVTAVPSMRALVQVQDKLSAHTTLGHVGLPQPGAAVISNRTDLTGWDEFPVFVKRAIGTATTGVRRVANRAELLALAAEWDEGGAFREGGVLVQSPASGPLVMVQTVFAAGQLIASHANLRVREGASGGASHKRSIDHPEIREHMTALGARLAWHGALSADAILTDSGPVYIDINPRLVEPGNAWRAGVDLVGALLEVATRSSLRVQQPGHAGVATHQLLLAVLGAAQHEGTRRAVLEELGSALAHRGSYKSSVEELTPLRHDLRAAIPVAVAAAATLAWPSTWRSFSSGAVVNYALTPSAWRRILHHQERGSDPPRARTTP